jgi:signal transduction histidine kinase
VARPPAEGGRHLRSRTGQIAVKGKVDTPSQNPSIAHLWAQAAHDLRQPVQAALLLARMFDGSSGPAELVRNARRIGTALESLCGMLETLTLLSRLEAGLQIVRSRTCELADVLAPTIQETGKIAAQRGIPLRFRNMRGLVRTNPKLLATATRSLLINGIKFGHGEVHACCRRRDNQVSLEVRFRGPSLDTATRRSAFVELSSRADGSIASELGLGLALLEPLCRRLGHGLTYSSSPADGRLLAIALPLPAPSR